MDLSFTKEQEAWREEIREFFRKEPPERFPVQQKGLGWGFGAWSYEFAKWLGDKGWISLTWPKEYGGQARSIMDKLILWEEIAYHHAPAGATFFADNFAHTIISLGSPSLKQKLLPGIARGEVTLWLALSEPEAGSDLLALETRAREDGDFYVLNGQKIWSSNAHLADYGFVLARTDATVARHKGLSSFVVDKRFPGITVRPLNNMAGEHYHNQVFFDDVRVPKDSLVGQKNQGFYQMLQGLAIDRFWGRFTHSAYLKRLFEDLVSYIRETKQGGRLLSEDPMVRQKLVELAIEIETCRLLFYRAGWLISTGQEIGETSSIAKLFADELAQRFFNVGMQILGLYCQLESSSKWVQLHGEIERLYLLVVGHTLAGGTSEVIRGTIATRGLGLPR